MFLFVFFKFSFVLEIGVQSLSNIKYVLYVFERREHRACLVTEKSKPLSKEQYEA